MFRNLLSRLFAEAPDAPVLDGRDAEVAIAALLIRVARSDDRYARDERSQIDRILGWRNGIDSVEAAERRAAAEMIEAEAPDTQRLSRTIAERVPLDDRLSVVSSLWQVVFADERRSPAEEATVRTACELLGVSHVESDRLRRLALDELGQPG